jgi:uncharacterized protein YjbJ (UPF0337 family)
MNVDTLKDQWKQLKGSVRECWGKLTDDDLEAIEGEREQLIGKIEERYGVAKHQAERQVQEWESTFRNMVSLSAWQRRRGFRMTGKIAALNVDVPDKHTVYRVTVTVEPTRGSTITETEAETALARASTEFPK